MNVDELFARADLVLSYNPEKTQAIEAHLIALEQTVQAWKDRAVRLQDKVTVMQERLQEMKNSKN